MNSKYKVTMDDGKEYTVSARTKDEAYDAMVFTANCSNTEIYRVEECHGSPFAICHLDVCNDGFLKREE